MEGTQTWGVMELANLFGLTGLMIILQILDSMGMPFAMVCCMPFEEVLTGSGFASNPARHLRQVIVSEIFVVGNGL